MTTLHMMTAILEEESNGFVALCPEFDIASQGDTLDSARDNLKEALSLFYEATDPSEVEGRLALGSSDRRTLMDWLAR